MPPKSRLPDPSSRLPAWQRVLQRLFGQLWVELAIAVLIILSVAMTIFQFSVPQDDPLSIRLEKINTAITLFFAVELALRFLASTSKRRFFREFWIDLLALLPLFRVFRAARAVRLLRLFRLLRLLGLISRLSSSYPHVLRRGVTEYLLACGLLLVTILFGTGALLFFEGEETVVQPLAATGEPSPDGESLDVNRAFWFSVYSLFAGEPIMHEPRTLGGKLVAVAVMFMGLTIFAMFTGTVSAFMVERLRSEGEMDDWDDLHDHLVICGWNRKAEVILREFHASHLQETPIAVIAEFGGDRPTIEPNLLRFVRFIDDDFTRVTALERAGIHRANSCVILSDNSQGRSEQDADARTILAALTVEKLNEDVYTCAELLNRSYGTHLEMGHVNDYVVSGEHSGFLLAQGAINRGLTNVVGELLTYEHGNQFYRVAVPESWVGKQFNDALIELKEQHNAILIAIHAPDGKTVVNPDKHTLAEGDDIVVIAENEITL